jgi:PAS domain S-box-containing protein
MLSSRLYILLMGMEYQSQTKDLTYKVPVEPFTEVGQIAHKYNEVISSLNEQGKDLKKLSIITEKNPCSIIVTDSAGNIEYVNQKFCNRTGYTKEEVMGKNSRILKSGKTPKKTYVNLWKAVTAGKTWRGEFCNRSKNGEHHWEDAVIAPLFNKEGKVVNYVAIKQDVTELKSKMEDLQNYKNLTIDRENKMIDLKKEINTLYKELGKEAPYDTDFKSS